MEFSGRTVIVTGGTGALGMVVVKRFAGLGANVAVPTHTGRSGRPGAGDPVQGTSKAVYAKADLKNENEVEGFVGDVFQRFGSVDVLVNAAGGYAGGKRIEEMSSSDVMGMMQLNALSAFNMCCKVLPLMKQSGYGRIVNVAAMTALRPQSGAGAYAISKRAVVTLTEVLALENRGSGITANAVAPAIIDTEANRKAMPDADFSKWASPDQLADVILFLASANSSAVSGTVVTVP